MKTIRNKNNPLSKYAHLNEENDLYLRKGIKYGWQMRPKINIKEWLFLVLEACKEEGASEESIKKFTKFWIGSSVTEWRIRKDLEKKGYL